MLLSERVQFWHCNVECKDIGVSRRLRQASISVLHDVNFGITEIMLNLSFIDVDMFWSEQSLFAFGITS